MYKCFHWCFKIPCFMYFLIACPPLCEKLIWFRCVMLWNWHCLKLANFRIPARGIGCVWCFEHFILYTCQLSTREEFSLSVSLGLYCKLTTNILDLNEWIRATRNFLTRVMHVGYLYVAYSRETVENHGCTPKKDFW
jgi:hypothetical protein